MRLGPYRAWPLITAAVAVLLLGHALLQLHAAERGVSSDTLKVDGTPVTVFAPTDGGQAPYPAVIISHGFAGSQQLMRSYALSLARRGYLAVTFDYYGHGRHPAPLRGDVTKIEGATQMLLEQTRTVTDYVLTRPDSSGQLAVLGHSMASDIIVRYAATDPRVKAVVAVSMFSPAVTADAPDNLLMIVGGLEGFLKDEALRVLGLTVDDPREAVTYGDFDAGSARRLVVAPGVEHVGVLYSAEALREAARWLDEVFDRTGTATVARRGLPIVELLLGLAMLAWPLSRLLPRVAEPAAGASLSWPQLLPAALVPALGTPLLLAPFPADFMGVLVGGYLAVHFLVYGLLGLAVLWWLKRRRLNNPPEPRIHYRRLLIASLTATAYIAVAFALALDSTVTSYAITPIRLPLVLATLIGTLSYFLVDEWIAHGESTARGGHLFTRVCFLLSLGIAVALSFEDLFFLLIIAAVIVIYFLVYGLFSRWIYRATGHPAVGAIANAVSFAWALGAVFPFLSG